MTGIPRCGFPAEDGPCSDQPHIAYLVSVFDKLPDPGDEPRTAALLLCRRHDPNATED